MVHVAHNGDNRRTSCQITLVIDFLGNDILNIRIRNANDLVSEFFDNQFGRVGINRLVLRCHDAVGHQ